jgi:hypothetical protein
VPARSLEQGHRRAGRIVADLKVGLHCAMLSPGCETRRWKPTHNRKGGG